MKLGVRTFKVFITLVAWSLLGWYCLRVARNYQIELGELTPVIPVISLLYLFNNFIRSEFTRTLFQASGHHVPRLQSVLTVFIASSLNFVLPLKVGSAYRALYLKKHFDLDLSRFTSNLLGFTIHVATACLILILMALLAIAMIYGRWNSFLFGSLSGILLTILLLPRFDWARYRSAHDNRISRFLNDFSTSAHHILSQPGLIAHALLTVVTLTLSNGISLFLVLSVIDASSDFLLICLLALTQMLSGLLSITPGAVGIQEAASAMVYSLVAIPAGKILLSVFSIRVINILTIAVLVYPAHLFLSHLGSSTRD